MDAETAAHECVSEEALQHLRSYKYSSVDKSFISRYILKHYVRVLSLPPPSLVAQCASDNVNSGMASSSSSPCGLRRIW
jgi:hypothetical protein